jgi:hypothetical protein
MATKMGTPSTAVLSLRPMREREPWVISERVPTADRVRIPAVLRDLGAEPEAFRVLLVATAAMGAAGLNPPVTSPGLPNIQAIIRAQPEVNALVLAVTLIAAGLLFIGGILGDADGRRGILLGALGVLTAANLFGLLVTSGPLFLAGRLVSGAAALPSFRSRWRSWRRLIRASSVRRRSAAR